MNLDGRVTISRMHPSDSVHVQVIDNDSGLWVCDIEMTLEQFAGAVMGKGYVPCSVNLGDWDAETWGRLGMKREHKTVLVRFTRPEDHDIEEAKKAAKHAIGAFEVDGWEGNVSDCLNYHRHQWVKGKSLYKVGFTRWVPKE